MLMAAAAAAALIALAFAHPGDSSQAAPWWAKYDPAGRSIQSSYALRESFYDNVRAKRFDAAGDQGVRLVELYRDDDRLKLDVCYALADAQRDAQAQPILRELSSSKDRRVAAAARMQLSYASPAQNVLLDRAYAAARAGDHAGAAAFLDHYLTLHPSDDRARLQLGYELAAVGRYKDAQTVFAHVAKTAVAPAVASQAQAQLVVMHAVAGEPLAGNVSAYTLHEGRFADTAYGVDVRHALGHRGGYAVLHVTNDTRTNAAPGAPVIFNDDAAVVSAGVQRSVGRHAGVFAEGGYSKGLRGNRNFLEDRFGARYDTENAVQGTRSHTALDASVTAYSRYAGNAIGYASAEHDVGLARSLRGVIGVNAAADSHRLFYNNYAEAFAGVQTHVSADALLRFEAVRGAYLGRGALRPATTTYGSLRAIVLFSSPFK